MGKRTWSKAGGTSARSDDGRRVAWAGRDFLTYGRDERAALLPVNGRYEGHVRRPENYYSALLVVPELHWSSGELLTSDETREMREDLAEALPVLGSRAVFVTLEDEGL